MANERPQFRHTCKDAKFLGRYVDASGKYDLYFQNGQVVARFSDDPGDYLMAGTSLASSIGSLDEAVKRAGTKGFKVADGTQALITTFTTAELLAHADEENKAVTATLVHDGKEVVYNIRANDDGSILLVEKPKGKKKKSEEVRTCTRDMIAKWPESLGEIWQVEVAAAYSGDDEEDEEEVGTPAKDAGEDEY